MATSNDVLCDVCQEQPNTKPAVKWCGECHQTLCADCLIFHSNSRSTKSHAVIDIDDFKILPSFVRDIPQYCEKHNAPYQNYCRNHDQPCCKKCIDEFHRKCNGLPPLDDVVSGVKSSAAVTDLDERLQSLLQCCGSLRKEKEATDGETEIQCENILEQIRSKRMSINQHLDKLEQDVLKELSEVKGKSEQTTTEVCNSLNGSVKRNTELLDGVTKMKNHASDIQTFLGIKKVEELISAEEENIKTMLREGTLNNKKIIFKEDSKFSSITSDVKKIGKIETVSQQPETTLTKHKDKQAQIPFPDSAYNISKLKIESICRVNIECDWITGCAVLESGKLIFSNCYGKKIVVMSASGSFEHDVTLDMKPYDVTCIDKDTVAVSTRDNALLVVDVLKKTVRRRVPVDSVIHGIYHCDGEVYFSTQTYGVRCMDLRDSRIRDLNIGRNKEDEYIAVHGGNVYCTDKEKYSVICYNTRGEEIWTFQNYSLNGIRGIDVDTKRNVYVACFEAPNVVVISPDGKEYKTLAVDHIQKPRTLSIDLKSNRLLVCGNTGPAATFSISYT